MWQNYFANINQTILGTNVKSDKGNLCKGSLYMTNSHRAPRRCGSGNGSGRARTRWIIHRQLLVGKNGTQLHLVRFSLDGASQIGLTGVLLKRAVVQVASNNKTWNSFSLHKGPYPQH